MGDAHPENFGALVQNNERSVFTINDVDDSGPCPVGLDLLRLMVSSHLYDSDIEPQALLNSYLTGLNKGAIKIPSTIKDLLKKSQKNRTSIETSKIIGQLLNWNNETRKVTDEEKTEITKAILSLKPAIKENAKILDLVARVKIGGGSGGQLRYEALIYNNGHFLHLELKEQGSPSIYPIATAAIPDTRTRILQTLSYTQPLTAFNFYNVVKINKMDMLVRPLFSGNLKIKLDRQSGSENKDLIKYEAYTLGLIHSRSIADITDWQNQLQSLDMKTLEKDVSNIVDHFEEKYTSLKQHQGSLWK